MKMTTKQIHVCKKLPNRFYPFLNLINALKALSPRSPLSSRACTSPSSPLGGIAVRQASRLMTLQHMPDTLQTHSKGQHVLKIWAATICLHTARSTPHYLINRRKLQSRFKLLRKHACQPSNSPVLTKSTPFFMLPRSSAFNAWKFCASSSLKRPSGRYSCIHSIVHSWKGYSM